MLHPELYTYNIDWIAWKKRFIRVETRSRDWDMIAREIPSDMNTPSDVWNWPLFTEEFCKMMIEEAEYFDAWTVDRHGFYATNDMLLDVMGLDEMYEKVFREFVYPCAAWIWKLDGDKWNQFMKSENFIVRYQPSIQAHLNCHLDESNYSLTIGLNDEFEGCGTWFPRQKTLAKPDVGECTLFPMPTHKHAGMGITEGKRYIIVSFCRRGGREGGQS